MNQTILPSSMSADERRKTWYQREVLGYEALDWHYGEELVAIITASFHAVTMVLGDEVAGPHLSRILSDAAEGQDDWIKILENFEPDAAIEWHVARLLEDAGAYGLYGVAPADVSLDERPTWLMSTLHALAELRTFSLIEADGKIARILDLALARHAIDFGQDTVDVRSLAILGGVTEGRMRNILSANDSGLEKERQRVTAASAAAWLKGRKEFFASIWQQPEEAPEAPSSDFSEEVVFVPVAADGSFFHPGLARGGKFTIGAKGEEEPYPTFEEALQALQKMSTPRWRRPNEAGNWGIVSGRDWKRVERSQIVSMS